MNYNIFLVEDDENLNLVLKSYLENEGWLVKSFTTGKDAIEHIENMPDLWILDIMLPDIDGYTLIKKIKNFNSSTPVIFISARDQDIDRLVGLELGSDDYLPKPFLPRELVIRTKNLLDRIYPSKKSYNIKGYEVDPVSRTVVFEKEKLDLTVKEYDLLIYFIENKNIALARNQILNTIWGKDYFGSDRVVDDLVRRLRRKMPKLSIETIYGFGYRMEIL